MGGNPMETPQRGLQPIQGRCCRKTSEPIWNYHVPASRGRIDYTEVSTPLSTRHFANYEHGEIYGLSATPARFRLRSLWRADAGRESVSGPDRTPAHPA